jgi:hypothetical protein
MVQCNQEKQPHRNFCGDEEPLYDSDNEGTHAAHLHHAEKPIFG